MARERHDLAIEEVDVFDSRTGRVQADRTVLIDGDTITDVIAAGEPFEAELTIAGRGRLLTPGFIDTHAHLLLIYGTGDSGPERLVEDDRELLARTYLTHGVTTIADMGQPEAWMETMARWEREPNAVAPDLFLVGGSLCSQLSWDRRPPMHHTILRNPEEARAKVAEYADLGAGRLKLYWKLERPEMEAVVAAGRELDLRFFAHVDNGIMNIQDTLDLGVRHFEHFFTLAMSVMDVDEQWPRMAAEYGFERYRNLDEWTAFLSVYFDHILRSPDLAPILEQLLDRMAEEGASISTTINMLAAAAGRSDTFSAFEPYPARAESMLSFDEAQLGRVDRAFDTVLAWIKSAHDRGVSIRIGTDARNGGEALLAELQLLGEAGISNADVLRIATFNGAKALGIDETHGVIEPGRPADMILFQESPLDDLKAVRGSKTVFKGGQWFAARTSLAGALEEQLADGSLGADEDERLERVADWLTEARRSDLYGPPHAVELAEVFDALLLEGRVGAARLVRDLGGDRMSVGEGFTHVREGGLNTIGYDLLGRARAADAVEVFGYIVELFPDSWNAYDSLGEGCLAIGDRERAAANYRRSLELNPDNAGGAEALRRLEEE